MEGTDLKLLDGLHTPRWPERVDIMDVGPRDGLQNEPYPVSAEQKLALIRGLVGAGLRAVEVTSFVSPKWIPQLSDAEAVAQGVPRIDGVDYSALVPNRPRQPLPGVRGAALRAVPGDQKTRRGRLARPQDQTRVLQLREVAPW